MVDEVDPCDQDPCKQNVIAFENSKSSLADAIAGVERAKAARLLACGGAGATLLAASAIIAAAGGPLGWVIGGLIAGAGLALSLDCIGKSRDLGNAQDACDTTRTAYIAAKNTVMSTCLRKCWPDFPTMACP